MHYATIVRERERFEHCDQKETFCIATNLAKYPAELADVSTDTVIVNALVYVLQIYDHTTKNLAEPYPFIVKLCEAQRRLAITIIYDVCASLERLHRLNGFPYTIDWWHRTPADGGLGPVHIAFRLRGLYEMSGVYTD